jgi:ribosomal protein S18 acetylase RimI-like enzyme
MIQLLPMTPAEYDPWQAQAIRDYADDKVKAGAWTAGEALERSAGEFAKLLPQGLASPDNWLFSIWTDEAPLDTPVGMLWVARPAWRADQAFIYDFLIHEPYRRRGYGRQALLALEPQVKALGLTAIGLHVFGHNHGAIALYEQTGYEITDINMVKPLKE